MSRKYNVLGLEDVASKHLRACLRYRKNRLCDVFQHCSPTMPLYQWCLKEIAAAPCRSLVPDAASRRESEDEGDAPVLALDHIHLRDVLENEHLSISEVKLFNILFLWATNGVDLERMTNGDVPDDMSEMQWRTIKESVRWTQAKEMANLISYVRIKPSYLTSNVRYSGLAPEDLLSRAFERQALEAELGRSIFDSLRGGSNPDDGSTDRSEQVAERSAAGPSGTNPGASNTSTQTGTANNERSEVRNPNTTASATPSTDDSIYLFIRSPADGRRRYKMKRTTRMSVLSSAYATHEGLDGNSWRVRLFYRGQEVKGDETLNDLRAQNGDTIQALFQTRRRSRPANP